MSRLATFLVYRHTQPDPEAWKAALDFATRWNAAAPDHPLSVVFDSVLKTTAVDTSHPDYLALERGLLDLERSHRVVMLTDIEQRVEPADIAIADFVTLVGVGLGEHFVRRAKFGPETACPACGSSAPWMAPVRSPFVIDESFLQGPGETITGTAVPPATGWDVVNLPDGGLAVSMRVLDVLRAHDPSCEVRSLVSFASGSASTRMVELIASVFVPVPCTQHDDAETTSVCSTCGTVLAGRLEIGWHVQQTLIGDRVMFARHPMLTSDLYFRRTAYEALVALGVAGVSVFMTARLCDHLGGSS